MPFDEGPAQIKQVVSKQARAGQARTADWLYPDLLAKCEDAAALDGEVVVAIRVFPASEYQYLYNRHDISIVRAKLLMRGYLVDTKTVMDSRCSKLVIVIENDQDSKKEVHAEKLK
ncbi:hypothetical protein BH10CYA1_BH10CYA1_62140 [soil metagenome]